jgi:hypothetical protein
LTEYCPATDIYRFFRVLIRRAMIEYVLSTRNAAWSPSGDRCYCETITHLPCILLFVKHFSLRRHSLSLSRKGVYRALYDSCLIVRSNLYLRMTTVYFSDGKFCRQMTRTVAPRVDPLRSLPLCTDHCSRQITTKQDLSASYSERAIQIQYLMNRAV